MVRRVFTVLIRRHGTGYVAWVLGFPGGCEAQGNTEDETLENVRLAIEDFAWNRDLGYFEAEAAPEIVAGDAFRQIAADVPEGAELPDCPDDVK